MKTKHRMSTKLLAVVLTVLMVAAAFPLSAIAAQYTYEYYAASGTKYIYQTCLYYSSSSNSDATNWLSNNGWTPVGGNFNAGDGNKSKYIHLGVKYTTDPKVAIRGFQVRDSSDRPNSYTAGGTATGQTVTWYKVGSGAITQTPNAGDGVVDLNKDGDGNDLTLYVTIDPKAGPPVTEYTQSQSGNSGTAQSNLTNNGWSVAWDQNGNWQDCNEGSGGDYLYEGYKSSATKVSTTNLRNAISNAKNYTDTTKFTEATVNALSTAITNAQNVCNAFDNNGGVSTYTQTNIDSYQTAITNALNALKINVNFNASQNGGTLSFTSPVTVTTGTSASGKINLSSYKATKSGWTFMGWATSSANGAYSSATNSTSYTVTSNAQFYAQFKKDLTVTYYYLAADGTVATDTVTQTLYNNDQSQSFACKKRANVVIDGKTYTFEGYRTDTTAAAATWTSGVKTIKATDTASQKVYAVYKTDLTFTQDSGKGSPAVATESKTQYLASTSAHDMTSVSFTVTSTTPTYAGGAFKGWDTSSDAHTVKYTAGNTISTKNNVNLYAVYDLYKYTVKFVDEDGTTVLKNETVEYGKDATAPASPSKASDDTNEYTFAGWTGTYTDVTSNLTITAKYTAKAHDFAITHLVLPTCTEYGADKYVCNNCGYDKTLPVEPNGHSLSTEPGYAATCTTAGITDKIFCTVCPYVEQAQTVLPALGHNFELSKTVEPTCSAAGYDVYTCTRCSLTEKRNEVAPVYNNHNEVEHEAVAATCTTTGTTAWTSCSICGATLVSPQTIIQEGHKWIAATCTAPKTCSVCGATEGEAKGHLYIDSAAKAATCTDKGYTAGTRCQRCGDVPEGAAVTVIPALGHTWVETARVEATCAKAGSVSSVCSVCNETKTDVIEKLPHTEVAIEDADATCTAIGTKGGTKCSVCGEIIVEPETTAKLDHDYVKTADTVEATCQTVGKTAVYTCSACGATKGGTAIPKVTHSFGAWTTVKAATCTEDGSKTRACKFGCGTTETKTLTAIGHLAITVKAKAPTCTTAGLTAGKECAFCGEIMEGCETIPAITHNYQAARVVAPTCEDKGYTVYKCANCGDTYNADYVDANGHTEESIPAVDPTCTSLGYTEGTKCSVCNKVLVKQETVNKVAHTKVDFGAVAATCTETGLKAGVKCSVCGRVFSNPTTAAALGHEEDLGTITTEASCIQEGVVTYKCIRCGVEMRTAVTGYTGHTLSEDYTVEGGMVRFTCTVCGVEIKTTPAEVGLPDTGCEKCGLHHQDSSVLFKYNGFYCKLVGFFRSILAKLQGK